MELIETKFIPKYKWDYLILLGDFLDMTPLNHHAMESGNLRELEGKRMKKDYAEMADILIRLRKAVGKKCQIVYFLGNHEEWAEKFVDRHPTLEGMMEAVYNLPFKELGIEVIAPRKTKQIGKIVFVHGDLNGKYTPANHAAKMVSLFGKNVVYGHHHTLQISARMSPADQNDKHAGFSIPALADVNPTWAGNKPNQWVNGFAVIDISPKRFTVYPIVSSRDGFIFNGVEYEN